MYSKFDAVLFDCDGVLVDSEPITNGLLRDMLEEQGWKLTPEACFQHFVGKAVMDEKLAIEANTGKLLTEAWMQSFRARRNAALEHICRRFPISTLPLIKFTCILRGASPARQGLTGTKLNYSSPKLH